VKNKKIYSKWINFAKDDLKMAEILFENKSYKGCIYHCHQAIEKSLKALLIAKNKRVRKTHDLADLLKNTAIRCPDELLEFIYRLNPYYNPIRYPDVVVDFPLKYDKKSSQEILRLTKDVSKWLIFQLIQEKK